LRLLTQYSTLGALVALAMAPCACQPKDHGEPRAGASAWAPAAAQGEAHVSPPQPGFGCGDNSAPAERPHAEPSPPLGGTPVDLALAAPAGAHAPLLMVSASPQDETDHMGRIRTLQLGGATSAQREGDWRPVVVSDFTWTARFGACFADTDDLVVVTRTWHAGRPVMSCIRRFGDERSTPQAVAIAGLRYEGIHVNEVMSLVSEPPPGAPDAQPGASTWYEVDSPDLVCWAGSVYCAFSNMFANAEVAVISDPPDGPQRWTPYRTLGRGGAPNLAGTSGALFVSYTSTDSWFTDFPSPGPILLCRSEDGSAWSEPNPTLDEPKAHSSALAADDDIGLVLVYTAECDDGWPLFAARSADFGETWGKPVMLSEPDVRCYRPDALICDGRLYVAYLEVPNVPIDPNNQVVGDPTGVFTMVLDPMELPVP